MCRRPSLLAAILLAFCAIVLHASPIAPSAVDTSLVELQKTILDLKQKLASIEAALPQSGSPVAPNVLNQPDEATIQAARDLLLNQKRLSAVDYSKRQIAWQPMKKRMVNWQPMKRLADSREPVIKAVEEKLSEVLRAAELLGVSAEEVLAHLKLRNAMQQ